MPRSMRFMRHLCHLIRHAELVSASYFLRAVGIKILKQVQDDGGVGVSGFSMTGWCRDDQSGWPFFVPLWLCARYIGAASGFGGAACSRAMGEGPPLTPPAGGRGILVWFRRRLTHNLRLRVAQSFAQCLQPALDAVGLKPHGGAGEV